MMTPCPKAAHPSANAPRLVNEYFWLGRPSAFPKPRPPPALVSRNPAMPLGSVIQLPFDLNRSDN